MHPEYAFVSDVPMIGGADADAKNKLRIDLASDQSDSSYQENQENQENQEVQGALLFEKKKHSTKKSRDDALHYKHKQKDGLSVHSHQSGPIRHATTLLFPVFYIHSSVPAPTSSHHPCGDDHVLASEMLPDHIADAMFRAMQTTAPMHAKTNNPPDVRRRKRRIRLADTSRR